MYGCDILSGISKEPFEIPHKISYPYIARCADHPDMKISEEISELVGIFETPRWTHCAR